MQLRKRRFNSDVQYMNKGGEQLILSKMLLEEAKGYIKRGTFSTEIVWGNHSYIFPNQSKRKSADFKKGMFLFNMVRKDARNFLTKNPLFKLPKRLPSIVYNESYDGGFSKRIVATDLNHAYWRIALNLGIISNATYQRGLMIKSKSVRLASLSTLGAQKKYFLISGGKQTRQMVMIEGDEQMARIYTLIRYTCFRMMLQIKKKLGYDFLAYKTDCIYYVKSKANVAMVTDFFEKHGLVMKQLE